MHSGERVNRNIILFDQATVGFDDIFDHETDLEVILYDISEYYDGSTGCPGQNGFRNLDLPRHTFWL